MKKKILAVICGFIIVMVLLAAALFAWALYDELAEKPLIRESLLEDDVELDTQEDDIQALLEETEALLRFGETGWTLGRAGVRQGRNSEGTMEYTDSYLYYVQADGTFRQEDGTESVCRRVRLMKESGRWIVTEAFELNETTYAGEDISGPMLEEILGLVEEYMSLNEPECDDYWIATTSGGGSITVFQENESNESIIAKFLSFWLEGTETNYRLEKVTEYPN